jgi:hypothetical protein
MVVELIVKKAHLTISGLHSSKYIAYMNWGLSEKLKAEFLNITPIERALLVTESRDLIQIGLLGLLG